MKTNFIFLVILIFIAPIRFASAQENWVLYGQSIKVEEFKGYHFRLQASIKIEAEDDDASTKLGVAIYTDNGIGFYKTSPPVQSTDWQTYTIEGVIDSAAQHLAFGTMCQYNGKFFYDNISIDIKTNNNQWKSIFIEDFENGTNNFKQGNYHKTYGFNTSYQADIYREESANKNNYLLISGNNVPNYGINDKVGQYADVNGIKLYYEIYGEGQPFVILHGNGGSIGSSTTFISHLINKYKLIAIDSRGQGKSTDTDAPLSYMQMANDVKVLLDQLNIDSVYVWGHSDGAILSLILAMEYPNKVKKALAFAPNISPDSSAVYQCAIDSDKKIIRESKDEKLRKLHQLMLDYPNIPFSRLSEIKAPVLIMVGDRDIIKHEHTLRIFQNIPNSHLCIIPGTTHGARWEKKDLFLNLMDDFFDKPFTMPDTRDWYK